MRINLLFFLVFLMSTVHAQYDTAHYIAPASWDMFNDQHEVVLSTLSPTPVDVLIYSSDEVLIGQTTVVQGTPTRYLLTGSVAASQATPVNTILAGKGLIVRSPISVGVNVRNVSGDNFLPNIKGNTSLTSKGRIAIGDEFRLVYFRDYPAFYSFMAMNDNTVIDKNGVPLVTLDAGESYMIGGDLLVAALGDLIESNNDITLTVSAPQDSPGLCADPVSDQLVPVPFTGKEYITVMGEGTPSLNIEYSTLVATEDNTVILQNGAFLTTLALAGDFITVPNGLAAFDVNYFASNRPLYLAQGAGQGCEHGMSVIPPLGCTGSRHIETLDFSGLDYSVFVIKKCMDSTLTLNGDTLYNSTPIPGTNWNLFLFDNTDVLQEEIILDAATLMHVGILQDGGQFGGFAYFSGFSRSGVDILVNTVQGGTDVIEGCGGATYMLTRDTYCDPTDTVYINVAGTATEGVDYSDVPDTLFFNPGEDTVYFQLSTFTDNIVETNEYLEIFIIADTNCDNSLDTVSSILNLLDYKDMNLTLEKDYIELCVDKKCTDITESDMNSATVQFGVPPYFFNWDNSFTELVSNSPYTSSWEVSEAQGNVPLIENSYNLTVTDACGNSVSSDFTVENNCPLCGPNVITPNGDGINEFLIIKNIDQYPEARVSIMNRWGNTIMTEFAYQNDWSSFELSEGVYFYVVHLDGETVLHGFFHLTR